MLPDYNWCRPLKRPNFKLPEEIEFIISVFDSHFAQMHFIYDAILKSGWPDKGEYPHIIELQILATADGASSLLLPSPKGIKGEEVFASFYEKYYPDDIDPPMNISVRDAFLELYRVSRNSTFHRLGLMHVPPSESDLNDGNDGRFKVPSTIATARTTDALTKLVSKESHEDPFGAFTVMNEVITAEDESKGRRRRRSLTIDYSRLYWGIRKSIERAIDTDEKCNNIVDWLKGGAWDRGTSGSQFYLNPWAEKQS